MVLSTILAVALLSTGGLTAASPGGQLALEAPRSFAAFADGDGLVVRWASVSGADRYVGEVDREGSFRSPSRFTVSDDGRILFERRVAGLAAGTWYVRMRSEDVFLFLARPSAWTHVERVSVTGRNPAGGFPAAGPWGGEGWGRARGGAPGWIEARAWGDDLLVSWGAVPGAHRYVLQLDRERDFRSAADFAVAALDGRSTQSFVVRDVPAGRWHARVCALDAFVADRGLGWSAVDVVDLGVRAVPGLREADFRDDRGDDRDDDRHPVFERHPGRGKGHLKHARMPPAPGRGHDRDEGDDD